MSLALIASSSWVVLNWNGLALISFDLYEKVIDFGGRSSTLDFSLSCLPYFNYFCCLRERIINSVSLRIHFKPFKELDVLSYSSKKVVEYFLYFLSVFSFVFVEEPCYFRIIMLCIKLYLKALFVDLVLECKYP